MAEIPKEMAGKLHRNGRKFTKKAGKFQNVAEELSQKGLNIPRKIPKNISDFLQKLMQIAKILNKNSGENLYKNWKFI